MSDTDTMRQELEAAGYGFLHDDIDNIIYGFDAPNGMLYFEPLPYDDSTPQNIIRHAYAHLQQQRELETLRTLFDLCVRTFDYPREVEMIGGGLSQAERAMLYEAFEARFKFLFGDTDDDVTWTDDELQELLEPVKSLTGKEIAEKLKTGELGSWEHNQTDDNDDDDTDDTD